MDKTPDQLSPKPTVTLLKAIISRNPVIPVYPEWIAEPDKKDVDKLLLIETGFWLVIKKLRLVPKTNIAQVVAAVQRRKAVGNMILFFSSIGSINAFLELFGYYERTGEHLALNVIMIGLMLLLTPSVFLAWRAKKYFKGFPAASPSDTVIAAIRKINIAFWILCIINLIATSFIAVLEVSTPRKATSESSLEVLSQSKETAFEEGPKLITDVLTMRSQGPSTIFSSFGVSILRVIIGGGFSVFLTFGTLYLLASTRHSFRLFQIYFGMAALALIVWEVYIFRKYRIN